MKKYFRNILIKIDRIFNSIELFVIEKWILTKAGLWPQTKANKWKILFINFVHIIANVIPIINAVRVSLVNKDYQTTVRALSNLLMAVLIIFLPMTIIHHFGDFKLLISELETIWFKHTSDKFPSWCEMRREIIKKGTKIMFFILCIGNSFSIFVFYIPNIFSAIQYFLIGPKFDANQKTFIAVE